MIASAAVIATAAPPSGSSAVANPPKTTAIIRKLSGIPIASERVRSLRNVCNAESWTSLWSVIRTRRA